MDHTQFNPNLTAALYVAEVLDEPLLGDFRRHLKQCSACADEVAYWERGLESFEGIRRFIARRVEQRHFRWVMVQLVVAFVVGVLVGAPVLDRKSVV